MKVKDLIKKLSQVDGGKTVYLNGQKCDWVDFTGISFDDNNDVTLYEVSGDKPA